jgi:conjugative relaxase-like TrwC/TraI family protein
VQSYWAESYTSVDQSYYSQNGETQGYWFGDLAKQFGLAGGVTKEHFDRLAEGQHPITGEQLIKHRKVEGVSEYRAAWDFTVAPHKSVSAAAHVGGDDRLIYAHRASVRVMMTAAQEYTQAQLGSGRPDLTTNNLAAALFEHTTARPIGGVPDPHLHTHAVVFNMTDAGGKVRSLDPKEWFRIQSYLTAVYQSEMAVRIQKLGYELERGKNFSVAIKGYTPEYLASISRRTEHIENEKEKRGFFGAKADHIIAHEGREAKVDWQPEELRAKHRADSLALGIDPDAIPNAAKQRHQQEVKPVSPDVAISYAKHKLIERKAVFDRYEVVREALRYGQGSLRRDDAERALDRRAPEFVEVGHYRTFAPGHRYTTPEMIRMEEQSIAAVRAGIGAVQPIAPRLTKEAFRVDYSDRLNSGQMRLVYGALNSRDRIVGIQGGAGTGKTTALKPLRQMIEAHGYETRGLAPTSGAAKELAAIGIEAETLQRFLARGPGDQKKPRVYFLDESSLASTKQVYEFLGKLQARDRVLLIGDIRQHQSVEAGRIFEELQHASMSTFSLNQIVRQKDPGLLEAVKSFAAGDVPEGLAKLDEQGRIHEHPNQGERYQAIAAAYAADPSGTLVVSPDNDSRQAINTAIRKELGVGLHIGQDVYSVPVLRSRQDLTKEDLMHAFSYEVGDVIRYSKKNAAVDVDAGDYATVADVGTDGITVHKDGKAITYNPREATGVQVYTTEHRTFAHGDRVQFTQPWRDKGIANRELATITRIDQHGNVRAKLDSGRTVSWNLKNMPHIDHGYALTSYSAQWQTVDRVLINVVAQDSRVAQLVDKTLASVATSRPRYDAQIFTDSADQLGKALTRTHEKSTALAPEQVVAYAQPVDAHVSQPGYQTAP